MLLKRGYQTYQDRRILPFRMYTRISSGIGARASPEKNVICDILIESYAHVANGEFEIAV
jgi:hypothetical protein